MGAPNTCYVAFPKGRTLREAILRGDVVWLGYQHVNSISFERDYPDLSGTHTVAQLLVDILFPR